MPSINISELLNLFVISAIEWSIFIFYIVLAILNLKTFKQHYKIGLIIGIVTFIMMIPGVVLNLIYFDPSALLDKWNISSLGQFGKYCVYIGVVIGILFLILKIGWYMIVYYVTAAEWDKIKPTAFAILKKTRQVSWRPIIGASAFGIAIGALSSLIFWALGIQESELIKKSISMFPHIKEVNPIITIPIASLALSVPAIIEELTYRGAIFGFLLRLSRNNRWAIVASTLFVSLIWALGHLSNTNAPLIKCIQIFIIGIVFCEFARRISIESAIASHIALNVTIVILAFLVF